MGQALLVNALILLQERTDDEPIHLCQGDLLSLGEASTGLSVLINCASPKCTCPCRVSITMVALFTSGDMRIHWTIYRRGSGSTLPSLYVSQQTSLA